jgi:hypothetical protein
MGIANWVENTLEAQPDFNTGALDISHMYAHPMPISIKQLVRVQQARDARARLAGKKFQKRRQVLCTDVFRR